MVRDLVIQTEAAKPAIGEIEMNLLAQSALRAYAPCNSQRSACGSSAPDRSRGDRLTNVVETEMPIDASQNVIGRDMVVEAEIIE
jgi:hypothetical protein